MPRLTIATLCLILAIGAGASTRIREQQTATRPGSNAATDAAVVTKVENDMQAQVRASGFSGAIPLARNGVQPAAVKNVEWPQHGGVDNIRYSALDQINRRTVATLQRVWTYDAGDAFTGSEMQSNPVVVGGVLYVTTPSLKVVAIDARTGAEKWRFDPSGGAAPGARFRHRGVVVHRIGCSCRTATGCTRWERRTGGRSRRSARTAASTCARGSDAPPPD